MMENLNDLVEEVRIIGAKYGWNIVVDFDIDVPLGKSEAVAIILTKPLPLGVHIRDGIGAKDKLGV